MARTIGILTAGGDSPGLNAAIRAVGKAAQRRHGMSVIGFTDGFSGLIQDRHVSLDGDALSGILTKGGTILGTSRVKVTKVDFGDSEPVDARPLIADVVERHGLKALVCLGGGGTMKNAAKLQESGIPVIGLPKTIDNDVYGTDVTLGFDTAVGIATEAIDRLHSTAHSHHRIMVVEVMGHNTGWLTLGSGLAGGADAILIPEVPFATHTVAESILARRDAGSNFSIVAVAEGAVSHDTDATVNPDGIRMRSTEELATRLEELTGLEARVTILGHVQRGGAPSSADRLLATNLGTAVSDAVEEGSSGVMIGSHNGVATPVPLDLVAGNRKSVPFDHPWIEAARRLGVTLGD